MGLPEQGQLHEQTLSQLGCFKQNVLAWRNGRVFAFVFNAGHEVEELVKEAFAIHMFEGIMIW